MHADRTRDELIEGMDSVHARVSCSQRELLSLIAEADDREVWKGSGARDMAHFVSIRYGISWWKAARWITAAHALERLPRIARALEGGELGIDKAVELCRFATPETEGRLIPWAQGVSCAAIRRRGDLEVRRLSQDAGEVDRARRLSWWYLDEGRRFGLEAELTAAEGAVVANTLRSLADRFPIMPGEQDPCFADARRADALVALCSGAEADAGRPTVVIHAQVDTLGEGERGCRIEDGGVIDPETARRLACDARLRVVLEDEGGNPLRLGRLSRAPSAAMMRQLRYRDQECRFPGCGSRRFMKAHHIVWHWSDGGRTDLDNLVLICTFHHKLVHEYGWAISRAEDGTVAWFRPDGARYRAGPAPPRATVEPPPALAAVG